MSGDELPPSPGAELVAAGWEITGQTATAAAVGWQRTPARWELLGPRELVDPLGRGP